MSTSDESPFAVIDDALGTFDWYPVARKEFQDTIRSMRFGILAAVFVAVFSAPALALLGNIVSVDGSQSTDIALQMMKELTSILVPLIAIIVGYGAITRERESGTLKLLLSQPSSRRDLVVGKVIGRASTVVVPILIGFVVGGLLLAATPLEFALGNYVFFALLTALLGLVFVGLGVGISAAVSSTFRSMALSVVLLVNFIAIWETWVGQFAGQLGQHTDIAQLTQAKLILFGKLLNPIQAYKTLVGSVLRSPGDARVGLFNFQLQESACEDLLQGTAAQEGLFGISCEVNALPIQFTDPAIVVYMLLWLAIPVAIGYWLFSNSDL